MRIFRHFIPVMLMMSMFIVSDGRADIAPDPLTTGGTSLSAKDNPVSVEMAYEEVDLYPSPEKNRVEAVFVLKNAGDKDAKFEVGFPDYFQNKLQDFQVEIDGKKQLAEIKTTEPADEWLARKKIFTYWMCWNMEFAKGQEHKVKVSYWVKTDRVFADLYINNLPPGLKEKLWGYTSGYVLRTGAGWAGKIGKAVIRIHYNDAVKKGLMTKMNPEKEWKYDAATNTNTLTLENFEPDSSSDISYSFKLCDIREEAELLANALKEKKLDPWAQEYLLSLIENKDNPLKLSEEERQKRVLETLEWMVPPAGPGVDQSKITLGAEEVVHKAYSRLFGYYCQNQQHEKARVIAPYYQKFVKVMLDRNADNKNSTSERVRNKYMLLENEYTAVTNYIAGI